MSTALTKATPLPPSPLATRHIKPLPEWVKTLHTPIWNGTAYELPKPTPEQTVAIRNTRAQLLELIEQTPAKFPELWDPLLNDLGELMLVKPHSADAGRLHAAATLNVYKKVLRDLPIWAIQHAILRWHMGKCESYDDRRGTYQTKWLPASSELRAIAERHVATVEWRIKVLDDILRERSELPKRRDLDNEGFRKIGNGLALDI